MPLGGRRLTIEEALAICRRAGFTRDRLITVVALMCGESGRWTGAYNINVVFERDEAGNLVLDADGDPVIEKKTIDRGLLQINDQHTKLDMTEAFRASANVKFAYRLSEQGTDFSPWMAYVNGSHEKFVAEVTAVWEADAWRALVPTIREELG